MTQYVINIGAIPNDGTGDPLRTAFNETNLNFDQVFAAGPVLSNIQIANNKIITTNTNGNLILAPNGIGVVQSNVSILPNLANLRSLGSSTQRWSSLYVQYANISGNLDLSGTFSVGDLAVTGNLTVTGNTIQVGNIVTETLTIQLANAASTANAANGSGITVGANDNIATMLYSSTSNTWTTNIGVSSIGNITAPYFIGNGSQLTGLAATYSNANVVTLLAGFGSNTVSTSGNITGGFIFGNISQANGFPATYGNSNVTTLLSAFGSNTISGTGNITTTANVSGGFILGNVAFANGISTYGNANVVANLAALGSNPISTTGNITAGNLNSPTLNNSGNIRVVASGNTWTFDPLGNLSIPGNIVGSGNILIAPDSASASSYLDIYLTGGPDIHIASNDNSIVIGRDTGANVFVGNDGEVSIRTDNGVTAQVWNFTDTGNLTLPGNTFAVNYANGDPVTISGGTANTGNVTFNDVNIIGTGNLKLQPDPANASAYLDIYLTAGPDIHIAGNGETVILGTDDFANVTVNVDGNLSIQASNGTPHTWTFDTAGNLNLPGNTIAINYLNGNLAFGTVTFNNEAVIGTGTSNTVSGLYLAPDPVSLANDLYLRVRGNIQDEPTHIHFDTGNNQYYNQFIGDDNKYVQLANTGNIVINSNDNTGNTAQWIFDYNESLTLPGGSRLRPLGANLDIFAGTGSYVNLITSDESSSMGVAGSGGYVTTTGGTWNFGSTGNLTAPGNISAVGNITGSNLITSGSGGAITMSGGNITGAGNISAGNVSTTGNITGAYVLGNGSQLTGLPATYSNANVATFLAAYGSNTISTSGNITSGNVLTGGLISATANITGGNVLTGGVVSATGNVSGGNLNVTGNIVDSGALAIITGGNGNIALAPNGTGIVTASGNISAVGNIVTAGNFVGNGAALTNVTVSVAGNIVGTQSNVTLVAGSYNWAFDNTGNLTLPGNTFAVNYANNTPVNAVTRFESSWTVPTGNSTQSFTVSPNETYYMWVDCNIPNGILTWNATATVTNTNVPVVGAQYAWVYNGGGTPIDFTSIPNQFVGTSNTIVRSSVAPSATTNRFDFGINNASGNSQTVRYGWIAIS